MFRILQNFPKNERLSLSLRVGWKEGDGDEVGAINDAGNNDGVDDMSSLTSLSNSNVVGTTNEGFDEADDDDKGSSFAETVIKDPCSSVAACSF